MSGWVTYDEKLAVVGARVASYPDHRGKVREGRIAGLYSLYDRRYMESCTTTGRRCSCRLFRDDIRSGWTRRWMWG